jgi:hypothetical protein
MVEPFVVGPIVVAALLTEAAPIAAAATGAAAAIMEPLRSVLLLSVRQPQARTTTVHVADIIRIRPAN